MNPKKEASPQEGAVSLFSVPACPSTYCRPKEAGRAQGEWACYYTLPYCDPPSGTKNARAQGVSVQGVSWGKGTGFYPRVPPSLWKGTPPLHREIRT